MKMKLTDSAVKNAKFLANPPAGHRHKLADGGGMYLHVKASGKYWRMDYTIDGKRKTLALGVYPAVTLAQARKARDAARAELAQGIDPGLSKRDAKAAKAAAARNTFEAVGRDWLEKTATNRADNTQDKVRAWLENDTFPAIGKMPIATIGPRDVLALVQKIEARGALDTAHRVKGLCGQVFRFAVATGLAERDVTADLKGALAPAPKRHYPAITDPAKVGELLRAIHAYTGHACTVAAMKLAPLVFVRPGELRKAEWAEINLAAAEWRIPGAKMKMANDHLVPLSAQAVAILREIHPITGHGQYVFPSMRTGERPMSENTLNACLRGMGYSQQEHTAHGFRATARTLLDEVLGERVDLIEHQLAHAVKDANGRAYNRTSHLPARRAMMQRWADYLDQLRIGAQVIPLRA